MKLYKNQYRVESTRLKGWDYSSGGYYFITICTKNKECMFGNVELAGMNLNIYGEILQQCWHDLSEHYDNLRLDQFVIMPNHIHGIMAIANGDSPPCRRHGLFEFIRALKTFSSRQINKSRNTPGIQIWQSRFYDRIIRDESELDRVREYIDNNPQNWTMDENYVPVAP